MSITAQLVPQLMARSKAVRAVGAACTAAQGGATGKHGDGRDAEHATLIHTSTLLLSWSLEDSLERSDAMRARGWESGRARTSYRIERFKSSDAICVFALVALSILSAFLAWVACSQWHFYPTMPHLVAWWGYVPFALLTIVPSGEELAGHIAERRLS
jgi:energy-coupling factor transport system permease protein